MNAGALCKELVLGRSRQPPVEKLPLRRRHEPQFLHWAIVWITQRPLADKGVRLLIVMVA